ncbi:MAG: UDP-N-acetylmuramoyl-L-alanyl-D-glutamate--2,6-diaminopimelate ligase [Parachlamydiales bacterium]|nr:UDP-N-acetylmuramoyl-L-alanyl-D-glutamate--2,6-diaminopimelate ligase [Parachlamydiales bacterium]
MKFKNLIRGLDLEVKGGKDVEVTGISSDSRTVGPGNLFIAKRGETYDGSQFIPQALSAGAVAIVTDIFDPFLKVTQIIHPSPQSIEAKLAARYYGEPSEDLYIVGVTGTKGKTTTTYLIKHLLDQIGVSSGLIGTVETVIGESRFSSTLTTHDVISNQKWLREMVQKGCKGAVLEVSSHGLAQARVEEIQFDLGIFTNLYPDHLDYHSTMEEYAAAKRKLFEKAEKGIFNADSPWSEFMGKGLTFGIEKGDIRAEEIVLSPDRTQFKVNGVPFCIPLIGKFNVYNALAAIAVGLDRGVQLPAIAAALATFGSVPARLQRIGNVFIDFAHTGEALENVLRTLKEISKGKVIVVFGCGGNRDPQRRTGMAKAADAFADLTIITNDNPRKEDPQEIAKQIMSGFTKTPIVELDRKRAIEMAIRMAEKDDLVLIAGKGHERVQIFAEQTIPFDDAEIVLSLI